MQLDFSFGSEQRDSQWKGWFIVGYTRICVKLHTKKSPLLIWYSEIYEYQRSWFLNLGVLLKQAKL